MKKQKSNILEIRKALFAYKNTRAVEFCVFLPKYKSYYLYFNDIDVSSLEIDKHYFITFELTDFVRGVGNLISFKKCE